MTTEELQGEQLLEEIGQPESPIKTRGAHVSVHVGCPNGLQSFNKEHFRNQEGEDINSKAAPTPVKIYDSPALRRANTLAARIRNAVDDPRYSLQVSKTVNTHVTGEGVGQGRRIKTRFIPLTRVPAWYQAHQALVQDFYAARDQFIDEEYDKAKEEAAARLQRDGLLGDAEYPTKEALRSKFYVTEAVQAASWESNLSNNLLEQAKEAGQDEAKA